tara:strand:- start:51 stop:851 length:801 start_codon:yes stop_codon:yes gene_type:complete
MKLIIKIFIFVVLIESHFSNAMEVNAVTKEKAVMSIEQLRKAVLSKEINKKEHIFKALEVLKVDYPADVNYLLGVMYYFGIIENINVQQAIKYLEISTNLKHVEATYLLGSILVSLETEPNIERGIILLESAAEDGHTDAMFNVFSLYKKGVYSDETAAFEWLISATNLGAENSSLVYAQEIYFDAQKDKDSEKAKQAISILEQTKFSEFKGEAYFLLSQIYANPEFESVKNKEKRDKYLEISASQGFERAKVLWLKYQELIDQRG